MTKRRSNLSFFSRGGLLFIVFVAIATPGCKKKTPPQPQSTPLPKKTEQVAAVPSVVPVKPVQTALSSARKAPIKSLVQTQISTA